MSFATGETSRTVSVSVNGDAVVEGDETVLLKLSVPDGVVVADRAGDRDDRKRRRGPGHNSKDGANGFR